MFWKRPGIRRSRKQRNRKHKRKRNIIRAWQRNWKRKRQGEEEPQTQLQTL